MASRKDIRAALVERLQSEVGVAFFSPTFMDFEQVPTKPALTLAVDSQTPNNRPGLPTTWAIECVATLHVATPKGQETVDDVVDDLLAQIETALQRHADEATQWAQTTLGGLCRAAYISGPVAYLSAGREGQTVVDIPITIETNPEVPT